MSDEPRPAEVVEAEESVESLAAIFGTSKRAGEWEPPARLRVAAVFGSVHLDYREARLGWDVTDLEIVAVFGQVHVTVPPDVEVEIQSSSFMGNVAHRSERSGGVQRMVRRWLGRGAAPPDDALVEDERPLLRIRAFAAFGNVQVRVRG